MGKYTYDNLSRRLQPGYNYVGQTNDRQPLLISAVGRLRDYLPTADCCVGPGRRAPNPPATLMPAVGCRLRILKHLPPTHPADGGGPRRPLTDRGWKTAVADSHTTRPPSFPAPLTLAAGRPAAWTVPCSFSFRSRFPLTIFVRTRPAARTTSCPRIVGTAKRVVLTYVGSCDMS
jgi:hypothetical protein